MQGTVLVSFKEIRPFPIGYDIYLGNLYCEYMISQREAAEKGYTHPEKW